MNKKYLLAFMLTMPVAISGCSYMPGWMGGAKENKPKLEGQRVDVLPVDLGLQPDESTKDMAITLPAVSSNEEWPQHTGMFNETNSNLAAAGSFDKDTHATAGEGEEFESSLAIRPVVGGGLVFVMDAVGNISAHNATDITNVRWQSTGVATEDEPEIAGGGLAYHSGKLYATSGRGHIVSLDATTGKQVWRKDLRVPLRSAPSIFAGKLYATTIDNQMFALNTADGEVVWNQRGIRETTGLMGTVSPLVAGEILVAPYSSGEIYALGANDGREIWSDSLSSGKRTQASALFAGIGGDPVVDGGVVFAVSSGGTLSAHALSTGQRAWERPVGAVNTPWISGDYLFLLTTDNTLICFVKFDGRIRWSTKLPSFEDEELKRRPISWKGPVLVSGKLAVISSNGQMFLLNATDGKIAGTKSIPEDVYTAPVVAGGRMYVVTQDATLHSLQ